MVYLPSARIAREGLVFGRFSFFPQSDALLTQRFIIFSRRVHCNVLGKSRMRSIIAPGTVRQQAVPNDKIAGIHCHGCQFKTGNVRYPGIAV